MKQSDIAIIGVVIIISAIVSFEVVNKVIVPAKNRQQQVETVNKISPQFPSPSSSIFNNQAIDLNPQTNIHSNNNQNVFSSTNN